MINKLASCIFYAFRGLNIDGAMDKKHIGFDYKIPIPTEYELTLRNKRFNAKNSHTESRVQQPVKKISKPKTAVLSKKVSELDEILLDNQNTTANEADGENPSGWGV